MAITIECRACDFFTDMEETSETNPTKCPQCGEQMFYAGTHRKYPEETFCSTLNFSTGKKATGSSQSGKNRDQLQLL